MIFLSLTGGACLDLSVGFLPCEKRRMHVSCETELRHAYGAHPQKIMNHSYLILLKITRE